MLTPMLTGLVHVTLATRSGNIFSSLVHAHDGATAIIITTANAADADGNVLQKMLVTIQFSVSVSDKQCRNSVTLTNCDSV